MLALSPQGHPRNRARRRHPTPGLWLPAAGRPFAGNYFFVPVHPIDPVVGIADGWTMTAQPNDLSGALP